MLIKERGETVDNFYFIESSQQNYGKDITISNRELQKTIKESVNQIESTKDRVDISLKEYNRLVECKEKLRRLEELINILPLPIKWLNLEQTKWRYREVWDWRPTYGIIELKIPINDETLYKEGMLEKQFIEKMRMIESESKNSY